MWTPRGGSARLPSELGGTGEHGRAPDLVKRVSLTSARYYHYNMIELVF